MKLIWVTLSGIAVLATCRQINDEAKSIISARLATIKNNPIRLIVTTEGLHSARLRRLIDCLIVTEVNCTDSKDLRNFIPLKTYNNHSRHQSLSVEDMDEKQVCIAIRTQSALNTSLWDTVFHTAHVFWCFWRDTVKLRGVAYERVLNVRVRPALLSEEEQAMFDEIKPLGHEDPVVWAHQYPEEIRAFRGDGIKELEWERDWAEGERMIDQ